MKRRRFMPFTILLISLFAISMVSSYAYAQASEPVVHAVLFYSPSCPHCHQVISEDLTPLFEKYGNRLSIIVVDISLPDGHALYEAAIERFSIPENRLGVPTLIVDNVVLVGSLEIPEHFPGLIEQYLVEGGVDWPDVPGLSEKLPPLSSEENITAKDTPKTTATPPTTPNPVSFTTIQATPVLATASPNPVPISTPGLIMVDDQNPEWRNKLARDPAGNMLAIIVLIGMLAAILWVSLALFRSQTEASTKVTEAWLIPILCIIGFGVAGYLAYVETAQVTAVCGPVGDCNTVQQSEYARLFGIIPIGILGLIGYIGITITWAITRYSNGLLTNISGLALLIMTTSGTLFSIYLTFLEPFVIGATCIWCLSSAILMTTLMLLSIRPAKLAISNISFQSSLHQEHK